MSRSNQVITKEGTRASVAALARIRIDPGLVDLQGNALNVDEADAFGPFIIASYNGTTFDVQNLSDTPQPLRWVASALHSSQHRAPQAVQTALGAGGADPSPDPAISIPGAGAGGSLDAAYNNGNIIDIDTAGVGPVILQNGVDAGNGDTALRVQDDLVLGFGNADDVEVSYISGTNTYFVDSNGLVNFSSYFAQARFRVNDEVVEAFKIDDGTDNYLLISTDSGGGEKIDFGNAVTNPDYNFLGSGIAVMPSGGARLLNDSKLILSSAGIEGSLEWDNATGHTLLLAEGGTTSGIALAKTYQASGTGVTAGDLVYLNGGLLDRANAGSVDTADVIGVAIDSGISAAVRVALFGEVVMNFAVALAAGDLGNPVLLSLVSGQAIMADDTADVNYPDNVGDQVLRVGYLADETTGRVIFHLGVATEV